MKKLFSFVLSLILLLSISGLVTVQAEEPDPGSSSPTIEKPVHITIVDEQGAPVSGATIQINDSAGEAVDTMISYGGTCSSFLKEGDYTLKIVDLPSEYIADQDEASISVTLQEAERRDDLVGVVFYDHEHPEICSNANHIGLETYMVQDEEGSIVAYCFNQNYDNPTPDSRYKRLVGSPELLYALAQNKDGSVGPQALYDHVLAIIYNSASVQAKYGLDNTVARYLTNMAIKNYTDPTCFVSFDDDGNSMLARDENGNPIRDENGNYVFLPGGTVLGSMVNHSRVDNKEDAFPQEYRDAYHELISFTYHPSDYYLYIYYPDNFQAGNTDTFQCLMSVFQVEPVRTTLTVRSSTQIEITKEWDDGENQDGFRPTAEEFRAAIHLLANDQDVTETYQDVLTVTDNENGTYTVSVTGLPKFDDATEEIVYKIREDPIPGYTAEVTTAANGETLVNTHRPETTQIQISKVWDDGDDADGLRPTEVGVTLLADGEPLETVQLTVEGDWTYTFTDLPVYREGQKIVYTVAEEPVEKYETKIDGYTVTNSYTPETTQVEITKTWDDEDDQDGLRPESVQVDLLADGKVVQTVTIKPDKDGNWSYTFQNLPKNSKGVEIVYTVKEHAVKGYETVVNGYSILNVHTPEEIDLPVTKSWLDSNDKAGKRPASITVHLYADGTMIETVSIRSDANGNWAHTFQDLPKYADGKEIKYTVTEDSVKGYYTSITANKDGSILIRNSTTPLTGDESHPGLWIALLSASLLGLCGVGYLVLGRKRKQAR